MDLCLCQWEGQMVWERACITCDKLLLTFAIHLNKTRNPPSFSPSKRSSAPQWLKQTKGSSRSMWTWRKTWKCTWFRQMWGVVFTTMPRSIFLDNLTHSFFRIMTFFYRFTRKLFYCLSNSKPNIWFKFVLSVSLMTKIHQQFLRANIFKVNPTLCFFFCEGRSVADTIQKKPCFGYRRDQKHNLLSPRTTEDMCNLFTTYLVNIITPTTQWLNEVFTNVMKSCIIYSLIQRFNVINSNNNTKLTKITEHYRNLSCFMQHLKKHAKNSLNLSIKMREWSCGLLWLLEGAVHILLK